MRVYNRNALRWKDDRLMVDGRWSDARIVPDPVWPKMFRVEFPKGVLSDMVNRAPVPRTPPAASCSVG